MSVPYAFSPLITLRHRSFHNICFGSMGHSTRIGTITEWNFTWIVRQRQVTSPNHGSLTNLLATSEAATSRPVRGWSWGKALVTMKIFEKNHSSSGSSVSK